MSDNEFLTMLQNHPELWELVLRVLRASGQPAA